MTDLENQTTRDERIRLLNLGKFRAVFQQIDDEAYQEPQLSENLQQTEWLIAQAKAHAEVIQKFQQISTVIPMKFPAFFQSIESLSNKILSENVHYGQLFQFLKGKTEWTLRIWADETNLDTKLFNQIPEVKSLDKQIAEASPGKVFILQKQRKNLLEQLRPQLFQDFVQKCLDEIKAQACNYKVLPIKDMFATQPSHFRLVLKIVCLIEEEKQEIFGAKIKEMNEINFQNGFSFDLTGPYAVFHFLD